MWKCNKRKESFFLDKIYLVMLLNRRSASKNWSLYFVLEYRLNVCFGLGHHFIGSN